MRNKATIGSSDPQRRSLRQHAAAMDAADALEELPGSARRTLQAAQGEKGRAEPAPMRIKPVFMMSGMAKGVAELIQVWPSAAPAPAQILLARPCVFDLPDIITCAVLCRGCYTSAA